MSFFGDLSVLEDEDLIASFDGAHSVSDDDNRSILHWIFDGNLNSLLVRLVQGWCGFVQKKDARLSDEGSGNGNSLFLTTWKFSSLETALCLKAFSHILIFFTLLSVINVSFNCHEVSFLLFLLNKFLHNFELFNVFCLANELNNCLLLLFHGLEQFNRLFFDSLERIGFDELGTVCDLCSFQDLSVRCI